MPNDEMKVISIITRKGGAGKTTLARALISAAMAKGKRCLVFDADPQQALARWANKLQIEDPLFRIEPLTMVNELSEKIEHAYENDTADYVFIDTIGAAGAWADDLAVESDVLVIPMMLSDDDLEITTDTFNWYVGLRDRAEDADALPSFHVVMSNVPAKQSKAELSIEEKAIAQFPVMDDYFMQRKQHKDASAEGFLHHIAENRRNGPSHLRVQAKHFAEALEEATSILDALTGG
ncbi:MULTISPECIES: ParA family protein [Rhodobacterales]|uniref:ParA family protein n=2 Tax=Rhodobacterales TaxID=204455 RepID=A0AAE3LUV1_9RHOB|nr:MULTISPECIES: ParA family protein [Rhodobacterales]MCV6825975.1 ParA family protein [Halocynthiibacter halioticoli]MCW4058976.1 ParA family protein [Halocynthiibacter sp. SDUM655004]SFO26241.1 chromosome partitioning protein [Roseovarius lutimaris]